MTTVQNPVANPLGGATVSGTSITIDTLVNPPTIIPEIIRNLVAENEGYFIEEVFAVPGFTVEGGAVIYTETFPEDHFLPDDQSIAPRAPGAKAPRLGSTRRTPKVSRPESWSGSIEVHDEARERNQVYAVQRQFTQAANTFADRLQTRGIETLNGAVTAWERAIATRTDGWRVAVAEGIGNTDPLKLPLADFAAVQEQFIEDKAGIRPDTLLIHQADAYYLEILYPDGKLAALLKQYGLTMRVSPQVTEGSPIFCKGKQVGHLGFEKPLSQEFTRDGERWTDIFSMETRPVWIADNAAAVLRVTGVDADE